MDERRTVLARLLRRMRRDRDLSQGAVAEALGYSQTYISKIELRTIRLPFDFVEDLCRLFGVDLADFVREYQAACRTH